MTQQKSDGCLYRGERYFIIAGSPALEFNPQEHGITPTWISTACYAGYWCDYEIQEGALSLSNVYIRAQDRRNYLPIYGVAVSDIKNVSYRTYLGINHRLSYSGRVVIVKRLVSREEGYQCPCLYTDGGRLGWSYNDVLELVFERGALVSVIDRSQQMAEIREYVSQNADTVTSNRCLHYPVDLLVGLWWIP